MRLSISGRYPYYRQTLLFDGENSTLPDDELFAQRVETKPGTTFSHRLRDRDRTPAALFASRRSLGIHPQSHLDHSEVLNPPFPRRESSAIPSPAKKHPFPPEPLAATIGESWCAFVPGESHPARLF